MFPPNWETTSNEVLGNTACQRGVTLPAETQAAAETTTAATQDEDDGAPDVWADVRE